MFTSKIQHIFSNCFLNILIEFFLNNILLLPIICLVFLLLHIFSFLLISLKNIFKIFFFTESILLLTVIFLVQYGSLLMWETPLNYFYCQIILASAAAEAALFLGLFSHLYGQQFLNWVPSKKFLDSSILYYLTTNFINENYINEQD